MKVGMKEKLLRLLLFVLFGGLYISSLTFMVRDATLMEAPSPLIVVLSFGSALLFGLVLYSVKSFFISLGAGGVLLLVRIFVFWDGEDWGRQFTSFFTRLLDIWNQIMGAPYRPEDGFWMLCLVVLGFGLLAACFFYKRVLFWAACLPPLICFLLGAVGKYEVCVPAALLLFFCLVILFLASRWEKAGGWKVSAGMEPSLGTGSRTTRSPGALPLSALLAAALAMGLAALLPAGDTPSSGIRSYMPQYADFGEFLQSFQMEGQWFNYTGFRDGDAPLGGDLYLDESRVMDVRAEGRTYLAGAAYRQYDGRSWIKEEVGTVLADPFELDNGRMEPLFRAGVYRTSRVSVTMRQAGDVLFYPNRPQNFRLSDGDTLFSNQAGNYYVQPALTPGDTYTAAARVLDFSSADTTAALAAAGRDYFAAVGDAQMEAYADEIQRAYTQTPAGLPKRVAQLAHELTDGQAGDYASAQTTSIRCSRAICRRTGILWIISSLTTGRGTVPITPRP